MPNYTFRCLHCQAEYNIKCSVDDREQVACPDCHSKQKQQIFSSLRISHCYKESVCAGDGSCPHAAACGRDRG